jgi:hypothetical protein
VICFSEGRIESLFGKRVDLSRKINNRNTGSLRTLASSCFTLIRSPFVEGHFNV